MVQSHFHRPDQHLEPVIAFVNNMFPNDGKHYVVDLDRENRRISVSAVQPLEKPREQGRFHASEIISTFPDINISVQPNGLYNVEIGYAHGGDVMDRFTGGKEPVRYTDADASLKYPNTVLQGVHAALADFKKKNPGPSPQQPAFNGKDRTYPWKTPNR